jgi:hypothetical protein
MKLQASVHGLGVEAAAAGAVVGGRLSAAHPSTAHEAPATARAIPVEIRSFAMRRPPSDLNHCERFLQYDDCDPMPVAWQATFGTL